MNKGLKSYTKQLNLSVGNINTYTNLYSGDANFIFTLPVLTTVDASPIGVGLVFNKQKESEVGMFGKGMKLNYEKKLEYINSTTINITNSDGTVDVYTLDEETFRYRNKETGLMIECADDFIITDDKGNTLTYEVNDSSIVFKYPNIIEMKSGDKITLTESTNYFYIHNEHADYIIMTKNSSGMINEIKWTKNNEVMITAYLTYTNSYLTSVVVKKGDAVINEYNMEYITEGIILTDVTKGDVSSFAITDNLVSDIYIDKVNSNDGFVISVEAIGNKTKVTDILGNVITYVFDNDGLLRFSKDERGKIVSYQYDMVTKKIISLNPIEPTKNDENLYNTSNIRNEMVSAMTIGVVSETDEFYTSLAGSTVKKVSGGGLYSFDVSSYLYKNEVVTLVAWVKQKSSNSGWITLAAEGSQTCTTLLNKTTEDDEYQPIVVGLKIEENTTHLSVYVRANAELYLGKIEIFKKYFGVFYKYDNLKLIEINNNGEITKLAYNDYGKVISTSTPSFRTVRLYRNDKGLVSNSVTEYGRSEEVTYDDKNRVLEKVISDRYGTKLFKVSNSYITDTSCISTDSLGNQAGQVNDQYGNTISVFSSLSEVLDYSYYENLALKSIGLRGYVEGQEDYTYLQESLIEYDEDHHNLIKKVTLKNGTYFTYEYNERDLLTCIKQGGMVLMSFLYDEYDNIEVIYRGERLEASIVYDDYGRISEVNLEDNLGNLTKYSYTYNDKDLLEMISKNDEVYKTYEYDKDSNIISITDDLGNKQTYLYENKELYGEIYNIDNKKIHRMFNPSQNGLDYFSIYNRLFDNGRYSITPFDTAELKLYINPKNNNNTFGEIIGSVEGAQTRESVLVKDVNVPSVLVNPNNKVVYNLANQNLFKGSFGFWINILAFDTIDSNIFEIVNTFGFSLEGFSIYVDKDQKVGVKYYDEDGMVSIEANTGKKIHQNQWVFIGFDYNTEDKTYINLYINEDVYSVTMPKHSMGQVACKWGSTIGLKVSGFMCGYPQSLTEEEILKYYNETKQIFEIDKEEDVSKNESVVVYPYKSTLYDIYPLNCNCHQLNGPVYYSGQVFPDNDCSLEDFIYDKELARNVFNAKGQKISFSLGDAYEMSISMLIKVKENDTNKRVLFELKQDEDKRIALYIDVDDKVKILIGKEVLSTNISVPVNTWTYVGLSYTQGVSSGSLAEYEYIFNVVVENNTITLVHEADFELTAGMLSIGRRYEDEELEILNGKIANLCVLDSYNTISNIVENMNYLKTLPVSVRGYDEFGRLIRKNIKNHTTDIMKQEITYKTALDEETNTTYQSTDVKTETIHINDQTITRTYTTDKLGRVISITDSVFGDKNYVYDNRGFLTYDNDVMSEYDSNGNITSYGGRTFGYASTNDRLTSFNNNQVTYDSLNKFFPLSINGMTLTWDGNRLKRVVKNNNTISFEYNEQGLRTKKTTTTTSNYYYNGDNLITEVNTNYRLDFLYDENNMLFGFIYNNTDKYYYVRDILLNILGIVDESGTLVVKYDCNAWGKPINGTDNNGIVLDTTTNNIGSINPFRYKGYYYDEETNLFLVTSRYYSPELGRFIQPADVSSLNPSSINGLNLYSYANNNPIGIVYSNSSVGGTTSSGMVNTIRSSMWNSIINNGSYNNYVDLNFLGNFFAFNENIYSSIAGVFEGIRRRQGLGQYESLAKASKILMHVGYWLNVGLSAYNNYHDSSLTTQEKWVSFGVDTVYTTGVTVGAYFLGMIPYVGPFLAILVPIGVEYLWSGELSIFGFDIDVQPIKINGKTIEEWVKYWVNSWFE